MFRIFNPNQLKKQYQKNIYLNIQIMPNVLFLFNNIYIKNKNTFIQLLTFLFTIFFCLQSLQNVRYFKFRKIYDEFIKKKNKNNNNDNINNNKEKKKKKIGNK